MKGLQRVDSEDVRGGGKERARSGDTLAPLTSD
jgi:hypothetical protein